ncbi:MAG: hypothetical protein M3R08_02610 [Bacteroidota bacterium]|nr:hypothetical protein [Bacteroidota bacterium]
MCFALATSISASASAQGSLHGDGMISVEGADVAEALITVVPATGATYTLDKGTTKFMLVLELNNSYLVIFEHPECLTKQLFFDTKVPTDYTMDHYGFPFEVVLQVDHHTDNRAYVGPVGYIMYKDLVNDFDYETNYTLKIDDKLKERMATLSSRSLGATVSTSSSRAPSTPTAASSTSGSSAAGSKPPTPAVSATATRVGSTSTVKPVEAPPKVEPVVREVSPAAIAPVAVALDQVQEEEVRGPIKAEVADIPLSEPPVEEEEEITILSEPPVEEEEEITIAIPEPEPSEAPVEPVVEEIPEEPAPVVAREIPEVTKPVVEKEPSAMRLPSSRGTAPKLKAPDPSQFGRQEELIVDGNKVTTIVRIVNELGFSHEYRRIAHKFGPVFYFKDEQSIPEHMYYDSTGLPRK